MNQPRVIQMELFHPFDEKYLLDKELQDVRNKADKTKESADKVRRGMFARHNVLDKRMNELETRLSILEKNLCQGGHNG